MLEIRVDFSKAILRIETPSDFGVWEDDVTAVISKICEKISDPNNEVFTVSGFGDDRWPVDVVFDLPVFLEQVPGALQAVKNKKDFEIDFFEQGVERAIHFKITDDIAIATCVSLNDWSPNPDMETINLGYLADMLQNAKASFMEFVELHAARELKNPLLKKWSADCSC